MVILTSINYLALSVTKRFKPQALTLKYKGTRPMPNFDALSKNVVVHARR